jgi:hypothetical protein
VQTLLLQLLVLLRTFKIVHVLLLLLSQMPAQVVLHRLLDRFRYNRVDDVERGVLFFDAIGNLGRRMDDELGKRFYFMVCKEIR